VSHLRGFYSIKIAQGATKDLQLGLIPLKLMPFRCGRPQKLNPGRQLNTPPTSATNQYPICNFVIYYKYILAQELLQSYVVEICLIITGSTCIIGNLTRGLVTCSVSIPVLVPILVWIPYQCIANEFICMNFVGKRGRMRASSRFLYPETLDP